MSVLCVLCAGFTTNAMAAGAVRALGGTGTYNGTSAASTATRSAPTRVSSLRVTPSSARFIAPGNSGTSASGTVASGTSQRLSIGKYLGGATTTAPTTASGGSSTPGSSSANVGELEDRIEALEGNVGLPNSQAGTDTLSARVAALEGNAPKSSDYVDIADDGTVSIDVDALMNKLEEEGVISGSRETELQYTENLLQWRYTSGDDTEWHPLLDTSSLEGDWATTTDLSNAIADLADIYLTKTEAATTYQEKISDLSTIRDNAAAGKGAADVLGDGFTTENTVASKISNLETIASGMATDANLSVANAKIDALETAVAGVYTKGETNALLEDKQDSLTTSQLAAVNSGVTSSTVSQVATNASDIATNAAAIGLNTSMLATKANAADVYTKDETYTKAEVEQAISDAAFDPSTIAVDATLDKASTNAVQNQAVANALPNFDKDNNTVIETPGPNGAYVLGYVNGKPAYIAVVDGNGDTGVNVPW